MPTESQIESTFIDGAENLDHLFAPGWTAQAKEQYGGGDEGFEKQSRLMAISAHIAQREGYDPSDVIDNYKSYSRMFGLSGDPFKDYQSIQSHYGFVRETKKDVGQFMGVVNSFKKSGHSAKQALSAINLLTVSEKREDQSRSAIERLEGRLEDDISDQARNHINEQISEWNIQLENIPKARESNIKNIVEAHVDIANLGISTAFREFLDQDGLGDSLLRFASDPVEIFSNIMASSSVQMLPAVAGTLMAGPAGGAAATFPTEFSHTFVEAIQKQGVDMGNPAEIEAFLRDSDKLDEAIDSAIKKASVVSLFGFLGGSTAGKVSKSFKSKTVGALMEGAVQLGEEVGGESLGQLFAFGEIDSKEVLMEMIASGPQTLTEVYRNRKSNDPVILSPEFRALTTTPSGAPMTAEAMTSLINVEGAKETIQDGGERAIIDAISAGDKKAADAAITLNMEYNKQLDADRTPDKITSEEIVKSQVSPTLERLAVAVEKFGSLVDSGIIKAVSLSTRIGKISKKAKARVEKMDQESTILSNEGTRAIDPFIDSINRISKKLSDDEKNTLKAEILNGDWGALMRRGVQGVPKLRRFLKKRANRLPELQPKDGKDGETISSVIENYFPRIVEDLDGLFEHLTKDPKGPFKEAIDAAEKRKGAPLTPREREVAINNVLKRRGGDKPSFLKKRTIDVVTPEMARFYKDPLETLRVYNHKMSDLISKREFLGERIELDLESADVPSINEESIASFIHRELNDLTHAEEAELKRLISSRLHFVRGGRTIDKIINLYKTSVALKYVSGIKTILVQLGDISSNIVENGIRDVVGNMKSRTKFINAVGEEVQATIDAAGIEAVDQELTEALKTKAKFSQFALAGLRKMDMAMKQNLLSTTAKRWERLAKHDTKKLESELMKMFDDKEFVDKVIKDLKSNKLTADLNFAFYTKLSEYHPTGISQHTKFYIDNNTARGWFVLKSFAFKRFDLIYNRALEDAIAGMTEATAGVLRKDMSSAKSGAARMGVGLGELTKILAIMYTFETAIEWGYYASKDFVTGSEDEEDRSFAELYFENVTSIFPFFNAYDFKRGIERGKMFEAVWDAASPPSPIGSDPIGELGKSFYKDEPYDWSEIYTEIPYLGQVLGDSKPKKLQQF